MTNSVLVLGARELGNAILEALLTNPHYSTSTTSITLLVRPSTLASPFKDRTQLFTTTAAEDIGMVAAELALNDEEERNKSVFIAGDTLTYDDLANKVADASGKEVVRVTRPLEKSRKEATTDPENKLKKYCMVFSEGKGYAWWKEETWNASRGMEMTDVKTWLARNWR